MDATQLLTADHNRFRGLVARFKAAKEAGDAGAMGTLAEILFADIKVHATIEEEVFYPSVRGTSSEVDDLIDEGLEEHHVVDLLVEEVDALEPGLDEWVAKVTVLIENLEHHADEEESELFPKVRGALDAAALDHLGDRLEGCKADLGAPTLADKIDLTQAELADLARDQKIPGRSGMDKDELAATVAPS